MHVASCRNSNCVGSLNGWPSTNMTSRIHHLPIGQKYWILNGDPQNHPYRMDWR